MGAKTNIFNYLAVLRMDMNVFNVPRTARAVGTSMNVKYVSRINGETFVSIAVQAVVTAVTQAADVLMGVMINIFSCIVTQKMDMNAFSVYRSVQAVQTTRNVKLASRINGETSVSTVVQVVVTIVTSTADALKVVMIIILNYIMNQRMDMNAYSVYRTAQVALTATNVTLASQIHGETYVSIVV